jgi:hypothetical protein
MTAPKNSSAALEMLQTLQAKRAGLVQTIDGSTFRRKGLAIAAEFGDVDARDELGEIEAEEVTAKASIAQLDLVVAELENMRDALQLQEAARRDSRNAAELSEAIDGLLAISDEFDAALDATRDLLAKREAFKREKAQILRRASVGKLPGARDHELADAILAYFDRYLAGSNGGRSYAEIRRVAESDSRFYGTQSPGMIERGPRALSPFERMMRRELSPRSAPIEVAPSRQAARR